MRPFTYCLVFLAIVLVATSSGCGGGTSADPCESAECDSLATCDSTSGTAVCTCPDGYSDVNGDGTLCTEIDECTDGTDDCDANATCTNTDGAFTCACNDGYSGDGATCADIDECTDETDDCGTNATCANTDGAFTCTCNTGWTGDGVTCADLDECLVAADNDCDANATCTNVTDGGGFTCACNAGWTGDGVDCADLDECLVAADNNCNANATCTNVTDGGGFTCACNTGWTGDGVDCVDLDECVLPADNNCNANATCTNVPAGGGFTCACNTGYTGDGVTCSSTCSADLGSATGEVSTGSNAGETNDFDGFCGGTGGLDLCFHWAAPNADTYQIDTFGSDYDTVLRAYKAGVETACNDDSAGLQSMVAIALEAGESIVIVVDAYSSAAIGNYVLNINISAIPPESVCDDFADNDSDNLVDCSDPTDCQPTADCVPGPGAPGDTCVVHTDCAANNNDPACMPDAMGWQDGYCMEWCNLGTPDCPAGSFCTDFGFGSMGLCMDECDLAADPCRPGFFCCYNPDFDANVCQPNSWPCMANCQPSSSADYLEAVDATNNAVYWDGFGAVSAGPGTPEDPGLTMANVMTFTIEGSSAENGDDVPAASDYKDVDTFLISAGTADDIYITLDVAGTGADLDVLVTDLAFGFVSISWNIGNGSSDTFDGVYEEEFSISDYGMFTPGGDYLVSVGVWQSSTGLPVNWQMTLCGVPCQDVCALPSSQCSGSIIQSCVVGANGCTEWEDTMVDCAATGANCDDSAEPAVCIYYSPQVAGDLIITEIMQNPAAVLDSAGEWFEVYNASGETANLLDLIVKDDGTNIFVVDTDVIVPPGGYAVFGNNVDSTTNGGVIVDFAYGNMALGNFDDEIEIISVDGTITIDRVAWDDGATFPDPTGASMSLDPAALDAVSNDDGTNWCEGSTVYGDGDLGSPGSPNPMCLAGSTLLQEDFNDLTGWTVLDNGGCAPLGGVWADVATHDGVGCGNLDAVPILGTGWDTYSTDATYAVADSDCAGMACILDTELRSPVVDCTGFTTVTLQYDIGFMTWTAGDFVDVEVTTIPGDYTGATLVAQYGPGGDFIGTENIDISTPAADSPTVEVRFHYYNADWEYFVLLDNLWIIAN